MRYSIYVLKYEDSFVSKESRGDCLRLTNDTNESMKFKDIEDAKMKLKGVL